MREKREGLFVVDIEALDARGRGEIILRGDVVFTVNGGIEAVEREKFGCRGGVVLGEEIFEVAAESAGGEDADTGEIIFEANHFSAREPGLDADVCDGGDVGGEAGDSVSGRVTPPV